MCLDISRRVVAEGRKRLADFPEASFEQGDMHQLPFEDGRFDTVLLMHALTYTEKPEQVLKECRRVMTSSGHLLAVTLSRHSHRKAVEPYDHKNLGFEPDELEQLARDSGFEVVHCAISAVEKRQPNFSVISLHAVAA